MAWPGQRTAAAVDRLQLAAQPTDQALIELLWQHAPELAAARARIGTAWADVERALLLPNPEADFSWNTIPVGPTNPPGLAAPLDQIPNYSVSLSWLLEIGKRRPRQQAARHLARAAVFDALDQLRLRYLDLLGLLGELAATERRISALSGLCQDAARLTAIQQQRADKGDVAQLDSDRAALEEQKLQSSLREQQGHLLEQLRACSELVGLPCEPFGAVERAGAFLERAFAGLAETRRALDERPDLQALDEQTRAAQAAARLARARAIPDPTLRAGYVRDRFVVSGNQRNSLFVGVSLPLPLFDHGQADIHAAQAFAEATARARGQLVERAGIELRRSTELGQRLAESRTRLHTTTLPLARSVVTRLEQAVARGGAPLAELLLARRTLDELLIDATELDLATFRLFVTRARLVGASPGVPELTRQVAP